MSRRSTLPRTGGNATPLSGHTNRSLHDQARATLNTAASDPLLDGLVGGYAMEASNLLDAGPVRSIDLDQLVDAVTGADENAYEYAGRTAVVLAAAGVLRAIDWARSSAPTNGGRQAA